METIKRKQSNFILFGRNDHRSSRELSIDLYIFTYLYYPQYHISRNVWFRKAVLMNKFIHLINNDKETINSYVMYVNCAKEKGSIYRDDLKLFARRI